MKKTLIAAAALAVVLILCLWGSCGSCKSCGGCTGAPEKTTVPIALGGVKVMTDFSLPTSDPDLYGRIARLSFDADITEMLLEKLSGEKEFIRVSVNNGTVFANDLDDNSSLNMTRRSLTPGDLVYIWLGDTPPTAGSDLPTFGRAVKVMTKNIAEDELEIGNFPRLAVSTGSNSYLAAAAKIQWDGSKSYACQSLTDLLTTSKGSTITANPGDALNFSFRMKPGSYTVSYGTSTFMIQDALQVINDSVIVPETAFETIYMTITAAWDQSSVMYAVTIQRPQ